MPAPILNNLLFTNSTGRRDDANDTTFNDAIMYGGFPTGFKIKGIKQIDLFSDRSAGDRAFITGFIVQYDGIQQPVRHGIVNVDKVGTIILNTRNELLVGITGRLKDLPNEPSDKFIASVGFTVLNTTTGTVSVKGPFYGTTEMQSAAWASFGTIVAFQGTTKDGIGITTLGFVKAPEGSLEGGN